MIEEANPEVVISIHQNSYHQSNVKGPQVFYYTGSEKGKNLAEMLQDKMCIRDRSDDRAGRGFGYFPGGGEKYAIPSGKQDSEHSLPRCAASLRRSDGVRGAAGRRK